MQRQYNSSLHKRLVLSRDKDKLAKEGNVISQPADIVKQPTVLEFLGMEEKAKYSETDLETEIIDKLQEYNLPQSYNSVTLESFVCHLSMLS